MNLRKHVYKQTAHGVERRDQTCWQNCVQILLFQILVEIEGHSNYVENCQIKKNTIIIVVPIEPADDKETPIMGN